MVCSLLLLHKGPCQVLQPITQFTKWLIFWSIIVTIVQCHAKKLLWCSIKNEPYWYCWCGRCSVIRSALVFSDIELMIKNNIFVMFTIYLYKKLNYGSILSFLHNALFWASMHANPPKTKYQSVSAVKSSDSNIVGLNILEIVLFVTNLYI